MTVVVAVLAVVVALLCLLVAGLLRSHAAILRRLHQLGAGVDDAGADRQLPTVDAAAGGPTPPAAAEQGRPAADLSGQAADGGALSLRVAGVDHDTVVVFLSTSCATCETFWAELAEPGAGDDARPVIVTRGPEVEPPEVVAELAPASVQVVMSDRAWTDYQVPGSPYVVQVDGPSGTVRGEGTAPSWAQVRRMLDRSQRAGLGRAGAAKAAADRDRERDIDRELLAAGIAPGDPSLYRPVEPVEAGPDGAHESAEPAGDDHPGRRPAGNKEQR